MAREAVQKSLVLLKNGKDQEKPLLPLDRNPRRILVIGRHADDLGYQCGGWTITKYGTSGRITIGMNTWSIQLKVVSLVSSSKSNVAPITSCYFSRL